MEGYVKFADADEYEVMHAQGRTMMGLPIKSRRGGKLVSGFDSTGIAPYHTNHIDLGDPSVVVYIQSRFWPDVLVKDLVFLTQDDVTDYFEPFIF